MEVWIKDGRVCNSQQLYTLRRVNIAEGKAKGVSVIEVCTAAGLQVDILPDSGMDLGQVRYRGTNVTYISKNGYDSPAAIMPYETEFLNTFPGGLLYTCGLRSTGPANRDGEEWNPLHGRYHSLMAEQVCTEVVDGEILIRGTLRETALFGPCLEVRRTIRIPVQGASVTVSDRITNCSPTEEEYMLLYHCNFGYPMVSEQAKVILPDERKTTPRTAFAATGLDKIDYFEQPVPGEEERVFFHEEMEHRASLVNEHLKIGVEMQWSETLPILAQWRSMASGDYVLGLEPTNSYIMGRKRERENGTLPVLHGFETVETEVTFNFYNIGEDSL